MKLLLNESEYDLWVRATCFANDDLIDEADIVDYVFDNRPKKYPCVGYIGAKNQAARDINLRLNRGHTENAI